MKSVRFSWHQEDKYSIKKSDNCSINNCNVVKRSRLLLSYRLQHADVKKFPYCGPTVLQWPVNLTVIWGFPLPAREMMHAFVYTEESCNNYTENTRRHCTKFSHPGDRNQCTPTVARCRLLHCYVVQKFQNPYLIIPENLVISFETDDAPWFRRCCSVKSAQYHNPYACVRYTQM